MNKTTAEQYKPRLPLPAISYSTQFLQDIEFRQLLLDDIRQIVREEVQQAKRSTSTREVTHE